MATPWNLATPNGIMITGSLAGVPGPNQQFGETAPQFQAGKVNSVLQLDDNTTLASTPTSGVWVFDLKTNSCTSLSHDWIRPETNCLAQGIIREPRLGVNVQLMHLFAGGGQSGLLNNTATLRQAIFQSGSITPWVEVDFGTVSVATINGMCVTSELIFLACDNGIFFSPVHSQPGGQYTFTKAIDNTHLAPPVPRWSSVIPSIVTDLSETVEIVVGAWWSGPNGSSSPGLFRGVLTASGDSGVLTITQGINQPEDIEKFRVLLATCSSQPANQFALIGGLGLDEEEGTLGAVLKRDVESGDWASAGLDVTNVPGGKITDPNLDGFIQHWAGAIAVHPTNPKLVAIGWSDSYFTSNNGGISWTRVSTTGNNIYQAIHGIEIISEGHLILATERGLYQTIDNGTTHTSVLNQKFPNLQFLDGGLDSVNAGLAAASCVNPLGIYSPSVYCNLHDGEQLWRPIDDFVPNKSLTTHSMAFVRSGQLFDSWSEISERRVDPFGRPPGWTSEQRDVPGVPATEAPGFAIGATWEAVDVPVSMSQTVDGTVIVAVGYFGIQVYGVFNGPDSNAHGPTLTISKLFDLSEAAISGNVQIMAIASPDGQSILFGNSDGSFFSAVPQTPGKPRVPNAAWTAGTWILTNIVPSGSPQLQKISARVNDTVYAISTASVVLRLDGNTLTPLPAHPASSLLSIPSENGMLVITTVDPDPGTVFQSLDKGQTWTDISQGLPAASQPVAIRHAREPGGTSILYLFTNGWSLWTKFIHPVPLKSPRQVSLSGRMGIEFNGIDSDAAFVSQTAALNSASSVSEFKVVGENEQVKVYLTVRIEYASVDDSVKVTYGVFLNNFESGNQGYSPDGLTFVVPPGSSQYTDVFVKGANDGSDNVNCNFLVSN